MTDPQIPRASASSPDEDPTGVRALLSGLPQPDPMPAHLVERINASLAAAQAQRAARAERATSSTGGSVAPLVASARRRPGRVLFALAGAAAAVTLIAVVGGNLFQSVTTATDTSASGALSSAPREAGGAGPQSAPDKAAADSASTPPLISIRRSETHYTKVDFTAQAQTLRGAVIGPETPATPSSPAFASAARLGTAVGLTDCLRAIGADRAQTVRADIAFYEGEPAVIIVATTAGIPVAYAVGPECSSADAAVFLPATSLP
ncbi:MAG: hypothetical protein ABIP19_15500 [Dermatophilaceae bacterium]